MYTRRQFSRLALAALPAGIALAQAKRIDSRIGGVLIGAQSYSFCETPLDGVIAAMSELGLGECELFSHHVEPCVSREELRKWRLSLPVDEIHAVRRKFDDAGINLYAYNLSFDDSFTGEEIDAGFEHAKALGVGVITSSSTLTAARRVAPFAEKHKLIVAFHGHSDVTDPNQFARPEAFAAALAMSRQFAINLDIGHFVAANYDPISYIQEQHGHILVLHLKDRKRNQGPNMPWGQGDTPIKEVLQLLQRERYSMRALIEYEENYRYECGVQHPGRADPVTEVLKCLDYCKAALA